MGSLSIPLDILQLLVSFQRMFQQYPGMKMFLQWAATEKHAQLQKMDVFSHFSGDLQTQLKEDRVPWYPGCGLHQVKQLQTGTGWNVKDFRTDFWSLKQAQHTQNLWMAESCSWEHRVNLLGIKTCSATVDTRAPRQTDPKAVIVFTF